MIRHRAVMDAVRDAIFLADIDTGMIVDANRAAESLCGRSIAELRSLHHTQLHPQEAAELASRAFAKDAQAPCLTEGTVLHKDGHRIPVEISFSHFTAPDGRRMLLGVFRDTTERNEDISALKQAHEYLCESEAHARVQAAELKAVMDAAPAAILIAHDAECRHISGNRTAHVWLRQPPGSNLSMSASYEDRPANHRWLHNGLEIPPEDLPMQRAALTGQPVRNCELELLFDDGASIDLTGNVEPMFDDHGRPQGAVAVFGDITERKRAEAALRENERRLVSIYNTVGDVIFHLSVEPEGQFRFVSVNAAFLRVTGLSLENVVGKTVNEVIPEPSLTIVLGKYRQAVEEKTMVRWEETSDYPTGRLTGEVSVAPVFDSRGICTHLVGSVHDITEHKRAEAALRESEERFRNVADTAPVMIWISGTDKLCTFFNKPWLDFTGRTMAQELGNGWAAGVHADDLDRCLATYYSSFDARRSFRMEYRIRRADGEYRWVLDNAIPRYREGEFIGFIGSCIDVTQQKLIEERLRANEVRLVDAQRLAKVGSWKVDVETNKIDWSDQMFRICGLPNDTQPDFPAFLSHVHPKDRKMIFEAQHKALSSVAPFEVEFRFIRPDGDVRFVRSIVEAIKNDRGAPVRFLGATQDITDQVNARELLQESEKRLRNAEQLAHVGNWQWDRRTNHTICSEENLRILGWPQGYTPGFEEFYQAVIPQDRERVHQWARNCLVEKSGHPIEFQIARPNGDLRTVTCTSQVLLDEDGLPAGMVGTSQDVTDSRRAQDEAFARQKLESVGTLASGIAHDFNNLLGGLLAHADLAVVELASGSRPETELQQIRDIAVHGAEIVRQLMIYAGKESEVLELVDISRIVSEMVHLLKVSVSKHAALETDLAEDLPAVRVNAAQLRQIAMNLVTNASEAIGDRDGVIRVATARVAVDRPTASSKGLPEGDYLQLEVSDTGRGMPPETQARVFDPFFTTKSAGRGLGLAVVHGIVRNLGGAIHLESEPGEGTTFRILLPSAEAGAGANPGTMSRAGEAESPLQEATVLIVEDEDSIRQPVARMLRKKGFEVLEAANGSVAIDLLRANAARIDAILLDLTIPGASSHAVLAEASQARPDLKVILTSAYSEEMASATMSSPLVRGFIRKPFQIGQLVETLRNVLSS